VERTRVVVAQPKSRSLRTTIPASIARILRIEEGMELGWDLQARENQLVLIVRVLKSDSKRRGAKTAHDKVDRA